MVTLPTESTLSIREEEVEAVAFKDIQDALDLPHLYTKPSLSTLITSLSLLRPPPPSWDHPQIPYFTPPGLTKWLTGIIASLLAWIHDDADKEKIWEMASVRLSERCGRTAMPPLTRKFSIPCRRSTPEKEEITITLHEPSLTSDNLGLKTWASSYLLSKRLQSLSLPQNTPALELGAGTGLVGLSAAAVLKIPVLLTDLPEIVPNLCKNVAANVDVSGDVEVTVRVLDWTITPSPFPGEEEKFGIVFAADPLYSNEHPRLLVGMIKLWLKRGGESRVVVEMPLRDGYKGEREDFGNRMRGAGLVVVEEGMENGWDDWGTGGGEVRCWWSVWGWAQDDLDGGCLG